MKRATREKDSEGGGGFVGKEGKGARVEGWDRAEGAGRPRAPIEY